MTVSGVDNECFGAIGCGLKLKFASDNIINWQISFCFFEYDCSTARPSSDCIEVTTAGDFRLGIMQAI